MFAHVPATFAMIASLALTFFGGKGDAGPRGGYAAPRRGQAAAPFYGLYSFPFGGACNTPQDALCVAVVLFHTRILERRLGTGRFLSFALICSMIGSGSVMAAYASGQLGKDPVWGASWIPVVSGLTVLFNRKVPTLGSSKIGPITISDKVIAYLAAARFVYAARPRGGAGDLIAAVMALAGMGVGVVFAQKPFSLPGLQERGPVVSGLKKLLSTVCGESKQARHATIRAPADDGAIPADVLAQMRAAGIAPADMGAAGFGPGAVPRHPAAGAGPRPAASPATPSSSASTRDASARESEARAADPEAVQMLMAIGLNCTEEQAAQALVVCNGNVDAAAHMLMDQ